MATKRWEDWATLALGIWLFVSPWALKFFHDIGLNSLAFHVVGAALAALAVLALRRRTLWSEWFTLVLGLWVIGAPWLLPHARGDCQQERAYRLGAACQERITALGMNASIR